MKKVRWPYPVLAIISVLWCIPALGVLISSIRPITEIVRGWWTLRPFSVTTENYSTVWTQYHFGNAFIVSLLLAGASTLLPLIFSSTAAYAFHFLRFPGRKMALLLITSAYVLPNQVLIIPLLKLWRQTGLADNLLSVIIPQVGIAFAWSISLVRTFWHGFPNALIEAAKIDGCNIVRIYWKIVLPNSLTPLVSIAILQFLWTWNDLLFPLIFLQSNIPLTVALSRISGTHDPQWELVSAGTVLLTIAPMIVFIFLQRYFTEGLARSGVEK
ncbi:transporter [candidate division KSB3 bacterium]|uniref:Transporter n=1 Tax=candidate division KSB3 bacterium TaxID=2044937 RepID=A0A2G6E9M1_9BACT|nr:MAG: transporter [candidate division KSB3 bacterium]PIE30840.1 MAG: transporter [candidate division KSB3 bacterium]